MVYIFYMRLSFWLVTIQVNFVFLVANFASVIQIFYSEQCRLLLLKQSHRIQILFE